MTETGLFMVSDATETKSGFDFAKWLVELDLDTKTMPGNFTFTVHSQNPIGSKNIKELLENYNSYRRTL